MLKHRLLATATAILLTGSFVAQGECYKRVSMFDGETLTGWTQKNGTASYAVVNRTIVGTTSEGSPNSFLCSDEEYGDLQYL